MQIYKCDRCGREINDVMDVLHLSIEDCLNDAPQGLNHYYDICGGCINGFVNWLTYGGRFDVKED